jgi:hypothetical protein
MSIEFIRFKGKSCESAVTAGVDSETSDFSIACYYAVSEEHTSSETSTPNSNSTNSSTNQFISVSDKVRINTTTRSSAFLSQSMFEYYKRITNDDKSSAISEFSAEDNSTAIVCGHTTARVLSSKPSAIVCLSDATAATTTAKH